MKKAILLISFLIFSQKAFCEEPGKLSVQFAPISFKAWGSTPSTISFQVQYKWAMAGYYYITKTYHDKWQAATMQHTFGIFYKPNIEISKKFVMSPIIGAFNHKFPTENGAWWAFGLNANYHITPHFGIYYQHLSNGWTAVINPGLDCVGVKYTF